MELPIWFLVVDFTYWTCFINIDLRAKWYEKVGFICGCLQLTDGKNVIEGHTHHVNEHEECNLFVQCYINDNKSIEKVTNGSNHIHVWPPIKSIENQVINLATSEGLSVL
jgi:hypothetical protein